QSRRSPQCIEPLLRGGESRIELERLAEVGGRFPVAMLALERQRKVERVAWFARIALHRRAKCALRFGQLPARADNHPHRIPLRRLTRIFRDRVAKRDEPLRKTAG